MASPAGVRLAWLPRRRVALGLGEHAAPSLLFILAGIILGPASLNVVSNDVLGQLDPVVSVALAILGIFIASGHAAARGPKHLLWLTGATIETVVTLALVGGAMYVLLDRWDLPLPVEPVAAAGILALCVAPSAAVRLPAGTSRAVETAAHLADLDDLPLVVLASIAVPVLAGVDSPALAIVTAAAAGLTIGIAGAFLFTRADAPAERGVFVGGVVALLGGAAAYATASPLATGLVAGWLWTRRDARTGSLVAVDLRKLQHPLVGLLLLFAGATIQFTPELLWLAAPLVLFRLTGKLAGSLLAARLVAVPAGVLATILAPPGVVGIAVALNIQQVMSTGEMHLVSAITVATVVTEVLAVVLLPAEDVR